MNAAAGRAAADAPNPSDDGKKEDVMEGALGAADGCGFDDAGCALGCFEARPPASNCAAGAASGRGTAKDEGEAGTWGVGVGGAA